MATAVRFVARRICSRALERPPQRRFFAATSAAVEEEHRMLLPRIGGSSLRRFSSSEPPNLVNKNKHLSSKSKSALAKRIEEKRHQLLDLLRQAEGESSMGNEHKDLQQLLQLSNKNNRVLATCCNVTAGALLASFATALVGYEFFFG